MQRMTSGSLGLALLGLSLQYAFIIAAFAAFIRIVLSAAIYALICSCVLSGLMACSPGFFPDMSRALGDPSVAAPTVLSFHTENLIDVLWPLDSNADSYALERALDGATPVWKTVYVGNSSGYADTRCADQERYLYRLTRWRGRKPFGPSLVALGIASSVCRDSLEPNDTEDRATVLDYDKIASLHCYSSIYQQGGVVLVSEDRDWYEIRLPPRSTAKIVVTEKDLAAGSQHTHIMFYQKAQAPRLIDQSVPIDVVNSSYAFQSFLCELYPDRSQFPADGGGAFIGYTISLQSIFGN
jgi:hypothetical protein